MVSDTLADAVSELDEYLSDDWYGGPGQDPYERIRAVRDVMDEMRGELDDSSGLREGPLVNALVDYRAERAAARASTY